MNSPYGLALSEPRIVMTKFGERTVQDGTPTEAFWTAWRADKDAVKRAGFGVSKDPNSGQWKVAIWRDTMNGADERKAASEASRAQDSTIDIPVPEGRALLPYQRGGVAYALARNATLIGDEMGLGKTAQSIAVANMTEPQRILVCCPASLKLNWRNEIGMWQTLGLPVYIINAGDHLRTPLPRGWYIVNYDIAHRYEKQLKTDTAWDLVILDEVHRLKTRQAKRTLFCLGGRRKTEAGGYALVEGIPAKRKLALTGTPICNRPAELFPFLHYLDPARWQKWGSFKYRYCAGDERGASNLEELQERLRQTIMVRRLKADVLTELPPKRRQVIALEASDDKTSALVARELRVHEESEAAIAAATYEAQKAEASGDDQAYAAAIGKLKKAQAYAFEEISKVRHEVALAKVPYVIEHLLDVESTKVVTFAHHKDVVRGIVDGLTAAGRQCVVITGDTPQRSRQEAVEAFQRDPAVTDFVGNIQAAGVGITLTASSHVVFAELDWVPGNVTQAEDRCHRIGQRDNVLAQHIVLDGSLDQRMAKMIIAKQAVIDKALDAKTDVDLSGSAYVPAPSQPAAEPKAVDEPKRKPVDIQLTADQVAAIHTALRILSGMDADRAATLNGIGFSRYDTQFGNELAAHDRLSPRQAAVAMKMVRKYRRQYSADLYEKIFGEAIQG